MEESYATIYTIRVILRQKIETVLPWFSKKKIAGAIIDFLSFCYRVVLLNIIQVYAPTSESTEKVVGNKYKTCWNFTTKLWLWC